jgi:hypothetical protein
MLSDRPQQPWQVRTASAGEWLKRRVGRGARLTMNEAYQIAAMATGGLDDAGDPYHEEGLRQLLGATRRADLTAGGRRSMRDRLWPSLARRMMMVDEQRRSPEKFAGTLRRPLIVMGPARSGTTLLHRLLAVDDRFRGVPTWELLDPFPPHDAPDRRRAMAWHWFEQRQSGADHIHYADPDTPEECSLLHMSSFLSGLFWGGAPIYAYAEWMLEVGHDLDLKMYGDYRNYLLFLQTQHPAVAFALKSPEHTGRVAALASQVPEAMLVNTVRDPVATSNSSHSLVYQAHRASARRIDVPRTVEMNLRLIDTTSRAHIAERERCGVPIIDVYYADLMRAPVDAVRAIYDFHGIEWPDGHEIRLQDHIDANPQAKFGAHRYSSDDFGLTDRQVANRFSDYIDYFGLDPAV